MQSINICLGKSFDYLSYKPTGSQVCYRGGAWISAWPTVKDDNEHALV